MLKDVVEEDQAAIVVALESGAASGDDGPLKRIDTHMSHLFLGDAYAYKLTRSRRHPFADMSTLEARRRACEAELAINRPLAPNLYEAALPVVRDEAGRVHLGGPGDVIDWVVKMRRFPDGALLAEIAEAGTLTTELIDGAVEAIVAFHAGLPASAIAGHAADYRRIIDGLRRTEAEAASDLGVQPAPDLLFNELERELARLSPLIEARRRAGWVRRGHGDLHLGNLCIFDGRVTLFDALAFDPTLATGDVIYDIAFLLMDLRARGLGFLANAAMNRYWDASEQPEEALALLPLFMGLRAAVRMAVAVERGDLTEGANFRRLALDLLVAPPPRLLAIGGLSGTGKSTLAKAIAPDLPGPCGARLLRTDLIRKQRAEAPATIPRPTEAYEPTARAAVYRALFERAAAALAVGVSVVADATFREDEAREGMAEAAKPHRFQGVWLRASSTVRAARVTARRNDVSDATAQVALAQIEPDALGPGWRVLDADRPAERVADHVRQWLAS